MNLSFIFFLTALGHSLQENFLQVHFYFSKLYFIYFSFGKFQWWENLHIILCLNFGTNEVSFKRFFYLGTDKKVLLVWFFFKDHYFFPGYKAVLSRVCLSLLLHYFLLRSLQLFRERWLWSKGWWNRRCIPLRQSPSSFLANPPHFSVIFSKEREVKYLLSNSSSEITSFMLNYQLLPETLAYS